MKGQTASYIPFEELAGGKLHAQYVQAWNDVAENITDPNRDKEATRTITISIKVKPTKNMEQVVIGGQVKTSLANEMPVATMAMIAKDMTGTIDMCEYGGRQVKGQLGFSEDGSIIDVATGEVMDDKDVGSNLKQFTAVK